MWWRVTGLGENQGAAITMETSIIIPKPNGNKQDRWTVMPKSCRTFSLLPMGWCITSTHKTKTLTEYHLEVIHHLCDAVWYKQLDLRATGTWQPCYNNVPLQFLGQKQHSSASSESISLDPAPCNLWLFSKLKMLLKVAHFESWEDSMQKEHNVPAVLHFQAYLTCFYNGLMAGRRVCTDRENTLKVARVSDLHVSNYICPSQCQILFLTYLIYTLF